MYTLSQQLNVLYLYNQKFRIYTIYHQFKIISMIEYIYQIAIVKYKFTY